MPNTIDSYSRALAAYERAASGATAKTGEPAAGSSFADMLKNVAGQAVSAGHAAEASSVAAAGGHGDISRVVTAVSEAEMTLQTVVAVRERVIDAYKEILRMPI
ncbi:MAG: flagellar hook-basal body complex protein FliE [Rhodospirillales bacterium]|nr:flagellar hook-basal body complex protein FliE [Rhodospirillales bacterium]